MANDSSKPESLPFLYFALLFSIAISIAFDHGNLQSIRDRKFTEISGPGGHPIGTVTAKNDPGEFWGFILFTSGGTAIMVLMFARMIVKEHRRRREKTKSQGATSPFSAEDTGS